MMCEPTHPRVFVGFGKTIFGVIWGGVLRGFDLCKFDEQPSQTQNWKLIEVSTFHVKQPLQRYGHLKLKFLCELFSPCTIQSYLKLLFNWIHQVLIWYTWSLASVLPEIKRPLEGCSELIAMPYISSELLLSREKWIKYKILTLPKRGGQDWLADLEKCLLAINRTLKWNRA